MVNVQAIQALVKGLQRGSVYLVERVESDANPYVRLVTQGPIRRGDCTIAAGAEFRFHLNGVTHWQCNISSTDTGDEWDGHFLGGLPGFDSNDLSTYDKFLFASPRFHFDIRDANVVKRWVEQHPNEQNSYATGIGPVETYQRLAIVWFDCDC